MRLHLLGKTSRRWVEVVLADFDAFLLDHAAAERKASAVALSLISHYPDRKALVSAMMDLAREELEHFYQVYRYIEARGLILAPDQKDLYVGALRAEIHRGPEDYFLDRLLVSGLVEARGCERFGMIADSVADPELAGFYHQITLSEARHAELFIELAESYFPHERIVSRLNELSIAEARIVDGLVIRAALH